MIRYIATFDPQAWIDDYAVSVDPEGPTEWDCTAYVESEGLKGYLANLIEIEQSLCVVDDDDRLKDDPAAPEWVREWQGPFTIYIRTEEES